MKQKIFKNWLIIIFVALIAIIPATPLKAERAIDVAREKGFKLEEKYQPAGSIITEINTGQILWQENANKLLPPASMSKLMTLLLAYEAIGAGKFNINTVVAANKKHLDISSRHSLSNNKILPGASYTVSELIDLIIVPSSAAATYMLADLIEPNPDKYAALLNEKATALGMTNTTYYNATIGVINKY
ncbi:hypothetical protein AZF37_00750 [endosymbiont 'TC1' of Trimyema compressum]|uniref:serine hydrolase n=1 Tax=endosymbiont 'TC1' of Trimyema compressum TaxID=243899 RepID=UPI0007F12999|nr:serine hydrolase [endosymbiont 'TC1' of Trimyema compressum]AMP19900.1 hypothetical protein AZF37_00750 [endosymbiont 'TC1' of Trimyema compressum]